MKWPSSTNRGTALLKLLHQREENVLVEDAFVNWFVDENETECVEQARAFIERSATPESMFQRIAYRYTILREKFFDDTIENAIRGGYEQLLLLGAGFDTRSLRLSELRQRDIPVIEVDTASTIERKSKILAERLGHLPKNLSLIPIDLNRSDIKAVFHDRLRNDLKTICIWQGVSYYLPSPTVSSVLDSLISAAPPYTLLGFDCCTPLMLRANDNIPGIRFNIARLEEIGEPYLFGMYKNEMEIWLRDKGYRDTVIREQSQLEEEYLGERTLPDDMWYVVSAKCGVVPAY
jgi:methyltransferase (TIGR00027 family)